MSGILSALAEVFLFLINLIIDLICLALLLASLPAFWRWPFMFESNGSHTAREKLRLLGFFNFLAVLLDILTLAPLCITLCSWRVVRLCSVMSHASSSDFYTIERRGVAWYMFLRLIGDIPFILMFVFSHITFWRIPFLYMEICKEIGSKGVALLHTGRSDLNSEYMHIIGMNALNGLIDIFLIPFAVVVFVTGYRVPTLINDIKRVPSHNYALLEQKASICYHALQVLVDFPFGLCGLLALLSGFQTMPFLDHFQSTDSVGDRRLYCLIHAAYALRDLFCCVLLVPLFVSIYRFVFCISAIKDAISSWADPEPQLAISSAKVSFPSNRPNGLCVRIQATKTHPSFALSKHSKVKLYIRNTEFWSSVNRVFGSAATTVGQAMLPLSLAPKHMDITPLTTTSSSQVDFLIDFQIGASNRTILKNAAKFGSSAYIILQVEYENALAGSVTNTERGTLFSMKISLDEFPEMISGAKEPEQVDLIVATGHDNRRFGQRLGNVFWKCVLVEYGLLAFDLIALFFLIFLHLFPHRVYRLYTVGCESDERKARRKRIENLWAARTELRQLNFEFDRRLEEFDLGCRQRLLQLRTEEPVPASTNHPDRFNFRALAASTPNENDNSNSNDEPPLGPFHVEGAENYYHGYYSSHQDTVQRKHFQMAEDRTWGMRISQRMTQLTASGQENASKTLEQLLQCQKDGALHVRHCYQQLFEDEGSFCSPFKVLGSTDVDALESEIRNIQGRLIQNKRNLSYCEQRLTRHREVASSTTGLPRLTATNTNTNNNNNNNNPPNVTAAQILSPTSSNASFVAEIQAQLDQQAAQGADPNSAGDFSRDVSLLLIQPDTTTSSTILQSFQPAAAAADPSSPQTSTDPAVTPEHEADLVKKQELMLKELELSEELVTAERKIAERRAAAAAESPRDALARFHEKQAQCVETLSTLIAENQQALSQIGCCSGKGDWSTFRIVVVKEVKELAYDTVAVLCALVVVLTLYRAYPLVSELCVTHNRRRACLKQFFEIWLDIWYVLKALLVFAFIRGCVTMPADVLHYMLLCPSVSLARRIVDYHLSIVLIDLVHLLTLVFAWDTFRWGLATLVFGVFSPCVILEGALTRWEDMAGRKWNMCHALFLMLLSSFWVIGIPVLVAFKLAPEHGVDTGAAVYFGLLGFLLWFGVVIALLFQDRHTTATNRSYQPYLYQRSLASYMGLIFSCLLELAQLLALVFSVTSVEMYGSEVTARIVNASNYVFATFGEGWSIHGVPFGVYLAIVLALAYFLVSSAPVVCEEMLHWNLHVTNSAVWCQAVTFLGSTSLLLVTRNIALLFVCEDVAPPTEGPVLVLGGSDAVCWSPGPLRSIGTFAIIVFGYYAPTAMMRNRNLATSMMEVGEATYPQLYRIVNSVALATCCVLCTLFYKRPMFVVGVVMVTMLVCLLWGALYGVLFNQMEGAVACSVGTVHAAHMLKYAAVLVASVAVLIHHKTAEDHGEGWWSLYVTAGAIAAAYVAALLYSFLVRWRVERNAQDTLDELRSTLLDLHTFLDDRKMLKSSATARVWSKQWQGSIQQATRCSQAALALVELEAMIWRCALPTTFLATYPSWRGKTESLINFVDRESLTTLLADDLHSYDETRNVCAYMLCCRCCNNVCSHEDSSSSSSSELLPDGWDDYTHKGAAGVLRCHRAKWAKSTELDRIVALLECVMSLRRAVSASASSYHPAVLSQPH